MIYSVFLEVTALEKVSQSLTSMHANHHIQASHSMHDTSFVRRVFPGNQIATTLTNMSWRR